MKSEALKIIQQQLIEVEKKMLLKIKKRALLLKSIHPQQLPAAKNLIHYLVLRNNDIRNLQDSLHINGLSSLASAESHIHSQVQNILVNIIRPKNWILVLTIITSIK